MNDLQIFQNEEFGKVRTFEENGKIWFCGSDVALALGYNQPHKAVKQHCKNGGTFYTVIDSMGRKQEARFINEPDLYRLICNSKLPTAEKFEKWVFEEVLPTIRKTGSYAVKNDDSSSRVRETSLIVAEVVNAIVPIITKSILEIQAGTSFKRNAKASSTYEKPKDDEKRYFKLLDCPDEIYSTVIKMLKNGASYKSVEEYCNAAGFEISGMSICRYYNAYFKGKKV